MSESAWPSATYREVAPPAALAPYVECVWGQAHDPGARPYDQPVLPDGCIDVVALGGRVLVAGPATRTVIVRDLPGTVDVGIRFRPGAAAPLLGVSAAELRDRDIPVGDLLGRSGVVLEERVAEAPSGAAMADELLAGLLGRLDEAPAVDPVAVGVAALFTGPVERSLPRIAAEVELSERQLRRRIDDAVGYSPRMLGRVLRFQRFLQAARAPRPNGQRRDLAGLAAAVGYADQAHLTRESRRLAGLPPAALLDWEERRLAGSP